MPAIEELIFVNRAGVHRCAFGLDNVNVYCNHHTQPYGSPWTGWYEEYA